MPYSPFRCSSFGARPARPGGSIGPGLTTLTRILRSFKSSVQHRAKDRIAALAAEETLKAAIAVEPAVEAVMIIDPPSGTRGRAFCTVNNVPLTFVLNI